MSQIIDSDSSPEEFIQYSLLPRINPEDEDNLDPAGFAVKVQAVPHPKFIPFEKKTYLSYGVDLKSQLEKLGKSMDERTSFEPGMKKTEAVRLQVRLL